MTDAGVFRKYLKPGEKPEARFDVTDITGVREYCTVHGLWRGSV
jgi:superoxide reductase